MNTVTPSAATFGLVNIVLGAGSALLVAGVWTGLSENLGLGARAAFWILFFVGLTMCALGPLGQGQTVGWWNARHIAGYILGGAALLLGAAVLFDFSLPLVNNPRAAVLALGLLMAAKVVIALLYPRAG